MALTKVRRLLQGSSRFQVGLIGLVLLGLGLQLVILALWLRTRAEAAPVLSRSDTLVELADQGPYLREAPVKLLLALAADELSELAESRIQYTIPISQSVRVSTGVAINERISVPVSLVVKETIPVQVEIPVQQDLVIPVRLDIDQVFAVDTTVPFKEEIVVPVDDVIHIDETFTVRVVGQDFEIPIRGDIPVRLNVSVPIDSEFPVHVEIPVAFPISETLSFEIDWTIPVDMEIPVNLPVETQVVVPLSRTIPLDVTIPVVLDVPIDIALSDTPLGRALRDLGERLRQVGGN